MLQFKPRPISTIPRRAGLTIMLGMMAALPCRDAYSGTIEGINHTHWAINRFSVDGRSGLDVIGPYQGGGGGCCYIAPQRWKAGMTVRVDWEIGASGSKGFPGFADEAKYDAWAHTMRAQRRKHTRTVPIPDYTYQKVCGITVHFLPCDDIQVTTSCHPYGSSDYPIQTPLKLPEPPSCPAL